MTFRPDPEVSEKLKDYCKRESRSPSNAINYALKLLLKILPGKEDKN